jgi:sugar phosphate isomerase/epimerase
MRFAIHNHGPSLPNLFPDAASVWRKISDLDPRMGICLDLAHERRSGVEPAESVRRYAGRIFDVHLNNIEDASDPDKYLATTLPKGVIDVSGVYSALKDVGYGGVLAIEYAKNFEDNMVDLRESVEHFRKINEEGM